MVCLWADCLFGLLYFVQISYCVPLNTVEDKEKIDLTQVSALSDTGGMFEFKEPTTTVPKNVLESPPPHLRVKRQSSGGKYTDAAKMPQVKVLRLFLQMFKNLWAPVYVGGAHPFHHEVPKPIVQLFKDKIMEFFFPPIGDEKKSANAQQ